MHLIYSWESEECGIFILQTVFYFVFFCTNLESLGKKKKSATY